MTSKQATLLLIRLSLGIIYLTSGLSKLAPEHLGNIIGPVGLEKAFSVYGIAIFIDITALIQILVGALCLSQRYAILGLVILFPLSVGIFIFTLVAGFGLTPIINALLLALLLYALVAEKEAVQKLVKFKIQGLRSSNPYLSYSNKKIPDLALILVCLTSVLSFLEGLILNLLATISFILFFINLFQRKDYLFLDYLILATFFLVSFIIVNAMVLNRFIPKAFYVVFFLIPIGFILYMARIIYWKLVSRNHK
ncbi:hypothetical protein DET49_11180 [Salegentibacter sp. 24]|jgi:hypothetical protein|uniref:hypothetical protein n=1 Tax=Salegentibacter sp. 24 TaxID=2183986 RepID=UPI00105C830C|nr:hypothetical protein [Salegentibacter sp. 24]TDN87632.1 hypothetical protein DET49_11180 [Salegentibacter sp. 24]